MFPCIQLLLSCNVFITKLIRILCYGAGMLNAAKNKECVRVFSNLRADSHSGYVPFRMKFIFAKEKKRNP